MRREQLIVASRTFFHHTASFNASTCRVSPRTLGQVYRHEPCFCSSAKSVAHHALYIGVKPKAGRVAARESRRTCIGRTCSRRRCDVDVHRIAAKATYVSDRSQTRCCCSLVNDVSPTIRPTFKSVPSRHSRSNTSFTCNAKSRVGTRTKARTRSTLRDLNNYTKDPGQRRTRTR
jgi:hypothetical protein